MKLPTQKQLLLPLLCAADSNGGRITSGDAYDAVSEALNLPDNISDITISAGNGRRTSAFKQRVRWARQKAISDGLLRSAGRGVWELTEMADDKLMNNHDGVIFTIYETALGQVLWGSAERAAAVIEPGVVDLIYTSPPYPLLQPKEYGNLSSSDWLSWMTDLCSLWKDLISDTGSLVLNIGSVGVKNKPFKDPYAARLQLQLIDQLGLFLMDDHPWHNPTKLPTPVHWCAVKKVRLKDTLESQLWFAKSDKVKANADNVRVPGSASTRVWRDRARETGQGLGRRPGGSVAGSGFLRTGDTAIPSALHVSAHEGSNSPYRRACKARGITPHPAIAPEALSERFILHTTEPGDLVYDPMAGSLTTCAVAERLGRRWIGSELSAHYIAGGTLRFPTGSELTPL